MTSACTKSIQKGQIASQKPLISFHPETVLFHLGCVNLQDGLCGVLRYASAPSLDFLAGTKNLVSELETDSFTFIISGWLLRRSFRSPLVKEEDQPLPPT